MSWQFQDADTVIERQISISIKKFFENEGEARFREIETEAIAALVEKERCVIATGGGSILSEANRKLLHRRCHVVYLRSSPEELYRRLRHDTQRPLLQVENPLAQIRKLHEQRDPLYRDVAHLVIDTGKPTVASLVNTLLMQLELDGVIDTKQAS